MRTFLFAAGSTISVNTKKKKTPGHLLVIGVLGWRPRSDEEAQEIDVGAE
jgi:hypothetical protein